MPENQAAQPAKIETTPPVEVKSETPAVPPPPVSDPAKVETDISKIDDPAFREVKNKETKPEVTKVLPEDNVLIAKGPNDPPETTTQKETDERERAADNPLNINQAVDNQKTFVATPNATMDTSKSHKERIIAYAQSKKGSGTIKLNDFLKSLYGFNKNAQFQGHEVQGNMRKLRQDLRELKEEGKISF